MSSNVLEQYQIIRSIKGGYLLEHKKTKERAIYKNIISHIYYEDQKQLIERRTSIQNCPQLQKYKFENNDQFLSNISIIYEDIALRFDAEINNRIKQKIYWSEEEILNTLESAVQALCVLHENHLVHGDIRPSSIACDLNGEVKLLDQFATSNHFFKNLQQVIQSGGYLTPELILCMQKDNQEYVLESRNDIFSLGLVFLEATTLISSQDIIQNCQVNEELLNKRIQLISKLGYSQRLIVVLSNMLLIDGDMRPSIQFIYQIGWANQEINKSYQIQDISTIPLAEGDSISHSIILRKVLGEQSTQISDLSKRNDNQQYNSLLSKEQQISQNSTIHQLNMSHQKSNKILDSQDLSLNIQPQQYQNAITSKNEEPQQGKQLNSQLTYQLFNNNLDKQQQNNSNLQQRFQHNRCKTECEEIKVYTKNSQKSFSKVGDETGEFKERENSQGQTKKEEEKSTLMSQKRYQDTSANEQYENCCPQCVKKMVTPLIRNAFSPRLEAIQDEESIRKSLIKQTPLIRMSKVKKELETFEPININNFQTNGYSNNSQQTLDQFYNSQNFNSYQRNIHPPLNSQSQSQLNRTLQSQQKSQQSLHQQSSNSNWNQSSYHFSSINQQSHNESFVRSSLNNPLKNIQNNQLLNRSCNNLKTQQSVLFHKQDQPQYNRSPPPLPPSSQTKNKLNSASQIPISYKSKNSSQVQRKPLFNDNQNYITQKKQQNQMNSNPKTFQNQ